MLLDCHVDWKDPSGGSRRATLASRDRLNLDARRATSLETASFLRQVHGCAKHRLRFERRVQGGPLYQGETHGRSPAAVQVGLHQKAPLGQASIIVLR